LQARLRLSVTQSRIIIDDNSRFGDMSPGLAFNLHRQRGHWAFSAVLPPAGSPSQPPTSATKPITIKVDGKADPQPPAPCFSANASPR
jgi:hypothetical protein